MLGDKDVCATIAVKDLAAASKFYEETLGLTKGMDSPGGIYFKSGNGGVFVYQSASAGTNQATYAAWIVDDVKATHDALADKGVTFEQYDSIPGVTRDGDIHVMDDLEAIWFKDPDGNILNVVNKIG